ncbi:hypothetical protein PTSG_06760 [Salpingoeca rosetta]|uniref:Uncharacterized protein n=1 Tax=Salpingoeca rosetta (strain ATCC 50818 / BSB-021) TaxID=946362 RepID=F2UEQ5_SALR5|nr:uncharacterized protein PTSG_06760 [Salpingoeca rosetta]EGD75105.1 hypothetical protein PTSG_06760 [Salpingoeca rosetta]|eukprot:XP_004992158.1 hypothetical protein PTSG_06760 [Salpingoeca rosetta]
MITTAQATTTPRRSTALGRTTGASPAQRWTTCRCWTRATPCTTRSRATCHAPRAAPRPPRPQTPTRPQRSASSPSEHRDGGGGGKSQSDDMTELKQAHHHHNNRQRRPRPLPRSMHQRTHFVFVDVAIRVPSLWLLLLFSSPPLLLFFAYFSIHIVAFPVACFPLVFNRPPVLCCL